MNFRFIVFSFLLSFSSILSASNGVYLNVNLPPYPLGMFSVFSYVGGILYQYDTHDYAGIKVDFEQFGLYYDPEYGPNWWQYYCKPICTENNEGNNVKDFSVGEFEAHAYFLQRELTKFQVFNLIQKYIHIQDHIQQKIDSFIEHFFSDNFIIGIHYRGTDKIAEAPRTSYEQVHVSVESYIRKHHLHKYKIFVATDESQFLEYMRNIFGDRVITYSTYRSENMTAVHFNPNNKYLHGEEAFIDCLLLSKGNVLIRTSSNLSLWSTYFNPQIPVIALSERY